MPVVTCEMLFQELMIVADLLYSPAQTSPVLTAPIHKQKIKVQSWRFVCFTRSCSEVRQAVNDRVLLTFPIIYLFGIANSVAVDALWQLSYTLSPHVLLRNTDGKSSAKAKGWVETRAINSPQALASSLLPPYLFPYFKIQKNIVQELYPALLGSTSPCERKQQLTSGNSWCIQSKTHTHLTRG